MSSESPQATRGRAIKSLAKQEPEQAMLATTLVRYLSSEDLYTPIGSEERDFEAAAKGEFREDFVDERELSLNEFRAVTPAVDWNDLFNRELEAAYAS